MHHPEHLLHDTLAASWQMLGRRPGTEGLSALQATRSSPTGRLGRDHGKRVRRRHVIDVHVARATRRRPGVVAACRASIAWALTTPGLDTGCWP